MFVEVRFPAYWVAEDTRFTPTPYHSTIEFLRQAQAFFHRFGFLVRQIGAGAIGGILNNQARREEGYNFFKNYITYNALLGAGENRGWDTLPDKGHLITCRMKSDGVMQLDMSVDFGTNFTITVGAEHQRLLGLPALIDLALPVLQPVREDCANALHSLDTRMSVDVEATLPISTSPFINDGKEESEFLLARFPINDYNRFETTLESTSEKGNGQRTS